MIYWDTSALLKVYAEEPDSRKFEQILEEDPSSVVISSLHQVEMVFALRAKENRGEICVGHAKFLTALFEKHFEQGDYLCAPWGDDLVSATKEVLAKCTEADPPLAIRSLDGIHLAAAVISDCEGIVTADLHMQKAAELLEIPVIEPRDLE